MSPHETPSQFDDEQDGNAQDKVSFARLDREDKEEHRKLRKKRENETTAAPSALQKHRQQRQIHTKHHKNRLRTQIQGGEKTKKRKDRKTRRGTAREEKHTNQQSCPAKLDSNNTRHKSPHSSAGSRRNRKNPGRIQIFSRSVSSFLFKVESDIPF